MRLPLFLDCDPGIDDALALAYLLCQDDVDIVGIAASGGNVPTAQVVVNTLAWLELAGRSDLPVHAGHCLPLAHHRRAARRSPQAEAAIDEFGGGDAAAERTGSGDPRADEAGTEVADTEVAGTGTAPADEVTADEVSADDVVGMDYADLTHGRTGVGYAALPKPRVAKAAVSAAQAWVDAARAHPGELIGVVIGPATNLALAIEIEPRLPQLLRRLFIMGGAFNYRGNTQPTTEWNVTFDPEATASVLAAFAQAHRDDPELALPVIAPIEATEAVAMTPERWEGILDAEANRRADGSDSGPVSGPVSGPADSRRDSRRDGRWQTVLRELGEALRFYFEFHEGDGLGYLAHIHDPFVVACAIAWARTPDRPAGTLQWAQTATAPVDVELTGTLTRGETVADWLGRWGREANAEIIRTIDADSFLDHLGATLQKGPHHDRHP